MPKLPIVKNYLKNVAKSVKYVAINEVEETIPMPFQFKETNADLYREARNMFRNRGTIKQINRQFKGSELFKAGDELYRNTISSIKTGKFYDKKRAEKADNNFFKMMAGDDFDFNMDEDLNAVEEDDSTSSLNDIGEDLNNLGEDIDTSLKTSSAAISTTIMEGSKFTADTIKNSSAISYMQSLRTMKVLQSGFASLSSNLTSIVKFQNEKLNTHIQNSSKFFETSTNLLTEQNAMLKEMLEMQRNLYNNTRLSNDMSTSRSNRYEDTKGFGGAVNLKTYFGHIKENVKNSPELSSLNMLWDMKDLLISNPLEFVISSTLAGMLGGNKFKHQLGKLQKSMSGLFAGFLTKMDQWQKSDNPIKSFLGSILGLSDSVNNKIDTGKFEKGPMQYNGIVNKTITDVIPGYLARIEAALTGGEERFFNMGTGRWAGVTRLRKEFNNNYKNAQSNGAEDLIEALRSVLQKTDTKNINGKAYDQSDINDFASQLVKAVIENNGYYDDGANTRDFYKKLNMSVSKDQEGLADFIRQILISKDGSFKFGLMDNVRSAKRGNSYAAEIANDPYHIGRLFVNNSLEGYKNAKYGVSQLSYRANDRYQQPSGSGRAGMSSGSGSSEEKYIDELPDSITSLDLFATFNINEIRNLKSGKDLINYISGKNITSIQSIKLTTKPVINFLNEVMQLASPGRENNSFDSLIAYFNKNENINVGNLIKSCDGLVLKAPYDIKRFFCDLFDKVHPNSMKASNSKDAAKLSKEDEAFQDHSSLSIDKFNGANFKEKFRNAKGLDKLRVVAAYTRKVAKQPLDLMSTLVGKVDSLIYTAFFGDKTIGKDGKPITGFIDRINHEITNVFEKAEKWLTDKFDGKFKDKFKSGLKEFGSGIYESASDSIKYIKDRVYGNARGLGYVPKTGVYMLSRGEAVIPSTMNPDNPFRSSSSISSDMAQEKAVGNRMGINVVHGYADGTKDENTIAVKAENVVVAVDKDGGDDGNPDKKKIMGNAWKDLKKHFPSSLGEGLGTGIVGALALGPFGFMLGGALGAANNILKNSESANQMLFGDSEKKSVYSRIGSKLLPDKVKKWMKSKKEEFKDVKNFGIGGGLLGLATGAMGGPVGLLGGMMLGGAVGWLRNNQEAQNAIFGTTLFGKGGKVNNFIQKYIKDNKYIKSSGIGAMVGGLFTGGPLGMVGGAMVGSAIQYVSESEKFKDFLFGKRKKDKDGNEIGEREFSTGFFGKTIGTMIQPFKKARDNIFDFYKKGFLEPFQEAMSPLGKIVQVEAKSLFGLIRKSISKSFNPKVSLPFWSNIGKFMKGTKTGRFLTGALGGASAGMMYGGPMGAILGGILGGTAHYTGLDKGLVNSGKWLWNKAIGGGLRAIGAKLNKRLINKGNADNMSAQERLKYMGDHGYTYSNKGIQRNDEMLKDATEDDIKVLQHRVSLLKDLIKSGSQNASMVKDKVVEFLNDAGLSYQELIDIKNLINMLAENKDPSKVKSLSSHVSENAIRIINNSVEIDPKKKKELIKDIKLIIPLMAETAVGNRETLNKIKSMQTIDFGDGKTFDISAYGDDTLDALDKANNLINKESEKYSKNGEEEKSPEVKLVDATAQQTDILREQLTYLEYIAKRLAGEPITGELAEKLNNIGSENNQIKNIENEAIAGTSEGAEAAAKRANAANAYGTKTFNEFFNTNFKSLDEIHNQRNIKTMWERRYTLNEGAAKYIASLGESDSVSEDDIKRIEYVDKKLKKIGLDGISSKLSSQIRNMPEATWKERIIPLLKDKFPLDDADAIAALSREDYIHLKDVFKKVSKIRPNYTQSDWMENFNNPDLINPLLGMNEHHIKAKELNEQIQTRNLNKIDKILPGKAAGGFISRSGLYMLSKGEGIRGYAEGTADAAESDNRNSVIQQYDPNSGMYLEFKQSSDGAIQKTNSKMNRDAEEALEKKESKWNDVLGYFKIKYAEAKSEVKNKGKNLFGKLKSIGPMGAALANLFGALNPLGGLFGSAFSLIKKIPGYSFMKNGIKNFGKKAVQKIASNKWVKKIGGKFLGGMAGGAVTGGIQEETASAEVAAAASEAPTDPEDPVKTFMAQKLAGIEAGIISLNGAIGSLEGSMGDGGLDIPDPRGGKNKKVKPGGKPKGKGVKPGRGGRFGKISRFFGKASGALARGSKFIIKGAATGMSALAGVRAVEAAGGGMSMAAKGAEAAGKSEGFLSTVAGLVKKMIKEVLEWVAKLMPKSAAKGLSTLGEKICGKAITKAALPKLAGVIAKAAGAVTPFTAPLVDTFLIGMAIKDYYDGYSNAETILQKNPNDPNPVTGGEKIIAGIANALSGVLCGFIDASTIAGFAVAIPELMSSVAEKNKEDPTQASESGNENNKGFIDRAKEAAKTIFKATPLGLAATAAGWLYDKVKGAITGSSDDKKPSDDNKGSGGLFGWMSDKFNRLKDDLGLGIGGPGPNDRLPPRRRFNIPSPYRKMKYGIGDGDSTSNSNADNAVKIWNYLASKGIGPTAIAGIMGNMQKESGFDPQRVQSSGGYVTAPNITVDGKTGYGLCQWTYPTRQQALADFAKQKNKPSGDMQTQLDFMLKEIGESHPGLISKMAKENPHKAALMFHDYEGSADNDSGLNKRGEMANALFKAVGKGKPGPNTFKDIVSGGGGGSGSSSSAPQNKGMFGDIMGLVQNVYNDKFGFLGDILGFGSNDSNGGGSSGNGNGGGGGSYGSNPSGQFIQANSALDYVFKSLKQQDPGAIITSPYNVDRQDHMHGGVDIGANEGTLIPTPVKGTVFDKGWEKGYGNYIQIKDDKGNYHIFPHLMEQSKLDVGTAVKAGDYVGKVGSTGRSSGPHLHYQIDPSTNPQAVATMEHLDPGTYTIQNPNKFKLTSSSNDQFNLYDTNIHSASDFLKEQSTSSTENKNKYSFGGPGKDDSLARPDYTDQINRVIELLGMILSAIQSTGSNVSPVVATAVPAAANNAMQQFATTTPKDKLINIVSSMIDLARH